MKTHRSTINLFNLSFNNKYYLLPLNKFLIKYVTLKLNMCKKKKQYQPHLKYVNEKLTIVSHIITEM